MEKKSPRIKMLLTPGEVAKRTGVAVSALHFYESKGLIHSQRNAGNQRRYRRDVLRAVAIIKIAQRIGIPLATIGDAFGVLPEGHNLSAKEWKMLSSQWREELDRRIHTLTALRDQLDGCIGRGVCLDLSGSGRWLAGDGIMGESADGDRLRYLVDRLHRLQPGAGAADQYSGSPRRSIPDGGPVYGDLGNRHPQLDLA